jgi:hypothetical protein
MFKALVIKSAMLTGALLIPAAVTADGMDYEVPAGWHEEGLPILRFQKDAARQRGWILTRSGVLVVDFKTRQTTAHVPLPGWTWAGEAYSCPPDLALGPKGEALVSSNVTPTLWRVDPVTLAVTRHELALDADRDKDVGFTGLVYSSGQGAFFAVSHFGALWRIDPLLRRAQKIELSAPMAGACGVTVRRTKNGFNPFYGLCVHGPQGGWTVNLAPDRRSAYVIARPCSA